MLMRLKKTKAVSVFCFNFISECVMGLYVSDSHIIVSILRRCMPPSCYKQFHKKSIEQ